MAAYQMPSGKCGTLSFKRAQWDIEKTMGNVNIAKFQFIQREPERMIKIENQGDENMLISGVQYIGGMGL